MAEAVMTLVAEPTHKGDAWVWEFICECGKPVVMSISDEDGYTKVRHGREGEAYREFSREEWAGRYSSPMSDWVLSVHEYERTR